MLAIPVELQAAIDKELDNVILFLKTNASGMKFSSNVGMLIKKPDESETEGEYTDKVKYFFAQDFHSSLAYHKGHVSTLIPTLLKYWKL